MEIPRGDVVLLEELGRGGFGTVFKATWHNTEAAVKMMHGGAIAGDAGKAEFLSEARQHWQLRNEYIVQLYGTCSEKDPYLMVMERMECSLFHVIQARKKAAPGSPPFSTPVAASLMLQVAKGMGFLHGRGVVHRDLKSLNVLAKHVDKANGECALKISDFGLAKLKASGSRMMTQAGTCGWMAPEVLRGEAYTRQADVFSFAMTCYEILTGKMPFEEVENQAAIMFKVVQGERPKLESRGMPDELRQLVERCWTAEPSKRPNFDAVSLLWVTALPNLR
jgi:serine/threonine protein kinase